MHGRDRFQMLLARFMLNPLAVNSAFADVYGKSLALGDPCI